MKLFKLPWQKHQAVAYPEKRPVPENADTSKRCANCNGTFSPTRKTNVYCGKCRTHAARRRRTLDFLVRDQGHVCAGCGHSLPRHLFTVDHIAPKSTLGKSDASNLHALCFYCNSVKRDRTLAWLWQKNLEDGVLPTDKISAVRTLFSNSENYRFHDWVDEQDFGHNDPSRFDDPGRLMDDFLDYVESQRGKAIYDDTA